MLVRAIRWRAGSSITMLVVAAAAILVAAFGPMYAQSADESIVRSTLAHSAVPDRGLTLTVDLPVRSFEAVQSPGDRAFEATRIMSERGFGAWFGAPITTEAAGVRLPPTKDETSGFAADLVSRSGVCAHLQLTAGRCATQTNDAMLSDRSAAKLGVAVGAALGYRVSGQPSSPLTLVGIYRSVSDGSDYWFGRDFLTYAPPPASLGGSPPFQLDGIFVTPATIDNLGFFAFPLVTDEYQLRPDRLNASNLAVVGAALDRLDRELHQQLMVTLSSRLPAIVSDLEAQESQMGDVIALSAVQLVLIDLLLLWSVVATAAQVREHEVALAKLRGHGLMRVAELGVLEPVALVLIAAPIGTALAWLAVSAAARAVLLPGTPVALNWTTAGAVALAVAAGAAAASIAGLRLVLRPLNQQLRGSDVRTAPWAAPAVDVGVAALAVAGVLELTVSGVLRGGQVDPLAVVAPGLLVLTATLVGIRLVQLTSLLLAASTSVRPPGAAFLVIRRLLRLPRASRSILTPALALGLATFAVSAYAVADQNRSHVAGFQVGASRVLVVQPAPGVNVLDAVRQADPSGRSAMAVVQYDWSGGSVLAVDSGRFPYVADWIPAVSGRNAFGVSSWLSSGADPNKLAAVVTPNQVPLNGSGDSADVHAEGLDGESVSLDGRVEATSLPRLGTSGALVDLRALQAKQRGPSVQFQSEVWLSPAAPADIRDRLAAHGLTVSSVESSAAAKAALDSQGLPLAFDLMLLSVAGAGALAVGAYAFFISAEARYRNFEVAVLRAAGWDSGTLVRTILGEHIVVVLASIALGAGAGIAGAAMTLPSVPEFTDPEWSIPLEYAVPATSLLLVIAAFGVLLLVTGVVGLWFSLQSGRADQLRAEQQ